jgi:putative membrane protein
MERCKSQACAQRGMKWVRFIIFFLGVATLAALTAYAGAGAVFKALAALRFSGLFIIALLHLPVIALMGWAWWLIGRDGSGGSLRKFAWARLVRDAAAECLPFSQVGGYVFGVRALQLGGVNALRGALSMSVDLVVELWAKLPYFLAGVLALYAVAPGTPLSNMLFIALGLTALAVLAPFAFRHRLRRMLEASARALSGRWPNLGSSEDVKLFFDGIFAEPGRPALAFAAHLVCWFLGAFETWVTLALMGVHIGAGEALAIDGLVSGLRSLGFLVPAAAGVQEASYMLISALFGIAPATAVALSFARRARELVLGVPTLATWQYLEAQARLKTVEAKVS